MRGSAIMAVAALAGCATTPHRTVAIETESIRYETAPCYGTCPVYAVTVMPDGRATFEGQRHTAVTGPRAFRITPAHYRAFAAAVQPFRPEAGERLVQPGQPGCGPAATDAPSVDVRWSEASGASQHLNVYLGCSEAGAMRDALRRAPTLLPIDGFIGPRPAHR